MSDATPTTGLRGWLAKRKRKRDEHRRFSTQPREDVFQWIYQTNKWGGRTSRSGKGSDLERTYRIREHLPPLLESLGVRSMLDLPCGDLNWIGALDLSGYDYIGADIVPDLIARNREKYPQHTFVLLDVCSDNLPDADFVLMRDLLVHLSFADIELALNNLLRSNISWVGATTFPEHARNKDRLTGNHRRLNLCAPPFNWPRPKHTFAEGTQSEPSVDGKFLGVWDVAAIRAARNG